MRSRTSSAGVHVQIAEAGISERRFEMHVVPVQQGRGGRMVVPGLLGDFVQRNNCRLIASDEGDELKRLSKVAVEFSSSRQPQLTDLCLQLLYILHDAGNNTRNSGKRPRSASENFRHFLLSFTPHHQFMISFSQSVMMTRQILII